MTEEFEPGRRAPDDGRSAIEVSPACSPDSLWCAARTRWLGDDGCALCREERDA